MGRCPDGWCVNYRFVSSRSESGEIDDGVEFDAADVGKDLIVVAQDVVVSDVWISGCFALWKSSLGLIELTHCRCR